MSKASLIGGATVELIILIQYYHAIFLFKIDFNSLKKFILEDQLLKYAKVASYNRELGIKLGEVMKR
jgi:hypothetical protein